MKTIVLALLVLAGVVAGCGHPETKAEQLKRWRKEYEAGILTVITNEVVGLKSYRIEKLDGDDAHPEWWTTMAQAEYVNHIGGVDRTNFWVKASTNMLALRLYQFDPLDKNIHFGAEFVSWEDATSDKPPTQ